VEVDILKERKDIPTSFIVTKTHYITTSSGKTLDECSILAARKCTNFT